MESPDAGSEAPPRVAPNLARGWLGRWPAMTFVLPFVVYMIITSGIESRLDVPPAEPVGSKANAPSEGEHNVDADDADGESEDGERLSDAEREAKEHEQAAKIPYRHYPTIYTIKIALTALAMLVVLPGYLAFPLRVNGIAWVIGVVGAVVWVGLCKLHLEANLLEPLGFGVIMDFGRRPGFNPLKELASDPQWAYGFLAIRFIGLVVIVPIIEEFFVRGFLMRYVMNIDWHYIPFGTVDRLAIAVGMLVPILMHPAELFASVAWFGMIMWLMLRTRNIWDCVVAHAVTNLLLGMWVVYSGDWWLM